MYAANTDWCNRHVARCLAACVGVMFMSLMLTSATRAAAEDEVRTTFERFVAAQNAHDIKTVESLLLGSPDFLWITRGAAVWGHEAAIKRFTVLYQGAWRLEPEASNLRIAFPGAGVAQVHVPIIFTIGTAGQTPQQTRFLMNLILVTTPNGWKVSSILPIPAPAQ
jgi:Domain of unknown function (DUF4440)